MEICVLHICKLFFYIWGDRESCLWPLVGCLNDELTGAVMKPGVRLAIQVLCKKSRTAITRSIIVAPGVHDSRKLESGMWALSWMQVLWGGVWPPGQQAKSWPQACMSSCIHWLQPVSNTSSCLFLMLLFLYLIIQYTL